MINNKDQSSNNFSNIKIIVSCDKFIAIFNTFLLSAYMKTIPYKAALIFYYDYFALNLKTLIWILNYAFKVFKINIFPKVKIKHKF